MDVQGVAKKQSVGRLNFLENDKTCFFCVFRRLIWGIFFSNMYQFCRDFLSRNITVVVWNVECNLLSTRNWYCFHCEEKNMLIVDANNTSANNIFECLPADLMHIWSILQNGSIAISTGPWGKSAQIARITFFSSIILVSFDVQHWPVLHFVILWCH